MWGDPSFLSLMISPWRIGSKTIFSIGIRLFTIFQASSITWLKEE
jgi:hypothetical protein